ncbi:hypothetical protein [Chelatococcus asaccharovorans]|uniref:hypothetical protein n=1 Tax=Chelatococcus asaccharovorans TaxID=28210 RepID=UPI00224C63F9|nr:hypothetical protein [Chelatococcus asaccharovorans]CAH1649834.1 conserved hypothetical protein [Chelatococcus asaccharovorans]CAH1686884.1 conserved hypothetical protein [Chelatococcus asaccharovorans]
MAAQPKPKRKRKRPVPRRVYFGPEKLRAAFLAGSGKSGTEIAQILGGTTGTAVCKMLRKAGIEMPGTSRHRVFPLTLPRRDAEKLAAQADRRDMTPHALAASVLCACVAEPVLIDNVLDEGNAP